MLFVAGMSLTFCFALLAQEAVKTSSIVLEVKDQSGAFVSNAHIKVVPAPNNIGKNLTADLGGKVSLDLSPGSYDLTVESSGFVKATKRVEVKSDAPQTIEIVLKIGSCSPCPVVSNEVPVSFPAQSQAVSPDGRYAIVGVDRGTKPSHSVFLEDHFLKTRRKLFNYHQHIVVLWKTDSKLFAVTDYVGSDSSRCSILSVDEKVPPIQVLDVLSRQFSTDTWKQLANRLNKDHVYVEAAVWDGPTSLMVKISGHGDADPGGFTEFAEVLLPVGHQ